MVYPSVFLLPLGFLNHAFLKTWKTRIHPAIEIISADGVVLGKYFQKKSSTKNTLTLALKICASLSSDRGRRF
jgi:hypothetical protein